MNPKNPAGIKQVNCPTCQKIVAWSEENIYRPFCSRKCQLIDFGDWANERNTIPVENGPDDIGAIHESPLPDELEINPPQEDS